MRGYGLSARWISQSGACGELTSACGGRSPPGPRALERAETKPLQLANHTGRTPLALLWMERTNSSSPLVFEPGGLQTFCAWR